MGSASEFTKAHGTKKNEKEPITETRFYIFWVFDLIFRLLKAPKSKLFFYEEFMKNSINIEWNDCIVQYIVYFKKKHKYIHKSMKN